METVSSAEASSSQRLRYAGAGLAYLVAALHLFHPKLGFSRLVLVVSANPELLLTDPRPLAFALSGFAIVAGVTALLLGVPSRPVYVAGIALMVTYVGGYFAWHLSGHGGFLPGRRPLYHGFQPHEAVIAHLTTDLWAAVLIVLEIALLTVLITLYRRES